MFELFFPSRLGSRKLSRSEEKQILCVKKRENLTIFIDFRVFPHFTQPRIISGKFSHSSNSHFQCRSLGVPQSNSVFEVSEPK